MAVVWLSVGSHESIKTRQGELSEICKTEGKANVVALEKPRTGWISNQ